jgi:hypothetical protein
MISRKETGRDRALIKADEDNDKEKEAENDK